MYGQTKMPAVGQRLGGAPRFSTELDGRAFCISEQLVDELRCRRRR
jgi:hypothetical protein